MKSSTMWMRLMPILFGFFVMGFVDVVGIATNYVKNDFFLSDTLANLIPMMVFLWFAVFSIPAGMIMGHIGKRNTVLFSMGITLAAMCLPMAYYNFISLLFAFALLGISNTILQVSLNPMIAQVVTNDKTASVLTLGQFIKAISSFLGPIIAGMAASYWGNWKLIFLVYAITTLFAALWLSWTVESEEVQKGHTTTFRSVLYLFSDKTILYLFIGILTIVGIDVGLNTSIPKLLMEQSGLSLNEAGLGTSLYFVSRTAGAFIGTFLLTRIAGNRFLSICMCVSVGALVLIMLVDNLWILLSLIILIGLSCSNVFSILFSYALQHNQEKANEISALMIMGVSGGALVVPFMGILSDCCGQVIGLFPLFCCMLYLLWISRNVG